MMSGNDKHGSLRETLIAEVADELAGLEGEALDEFLTDIGQDPAALLEQSKSAMAGAVRRQKMVRFENVRKQLRRRTPPNTATISGFDLAKKQDLLRRIKKHSEDSGEMTIAARNQKIESEEDLDAFLEACLRLGLIDEDGNMKD